MTRNFAGGSFPFVVDEGFQVVFRSTRGRWVRIASALASLLVAAFCLGLLLQEESPGKLAWLVASLFVLVASMVFFLVGRALDPGHVVVDGSLRTVELPKGAQLSFQRIRSICCREEGVLRLLLDEGEIRLVQRGRAQAEEAGRAVSRLLGHPWDP